MSKTRTIYILSRLHHALRHRIETALIDTGLTAVQYTVLNMLNGREQLSSAEIARRYCVKPQSMNETIFALERRKLISRQENPENKRILHVSLTPEGRSLLRRCDGLVNAIEAEIFSQLSQSERTHFHATLRKLLFSTIVTDESV